MISMQNYKKLLIYKPVAIKNLLNFRNSLFLNAEAQREKEYMTHVYGERTRRNAKAFRRVRRAVRRSLCPLQAARLLSVHSHIQCDIKKSLRLCVEY